MVRTRRAIVVAAAVSIALAGGLSACTPTVGITPSPTSTAADDAAPSTDVGVEAVIVVAGLDVDGANVSASGYVSGVVEEGGVCQFVFTGSSGEVTAESTGVYDANSTSCGLVQVPSSSFTRGSYSLVLKYSSPTTETVSEPMAVEIA